LGRAAIAALLRTRRLVTVAQISKAIGPATHNVAEYRALIEGLKLARDYGVQRIRVYMDSELVVDQQPMSARIPSISDASSARSEPEGSIKGSIPTARWRSCKFARNNKRRFAAFLQSPLTDSNRRPPPYHFGVVATGGNPRQRILLVLAVFADSPFAADCHWLRLLGSTNAPSLGDLFSRGRTKVPFMSDTVSSGRQDLKTSTTAYRFVEFGRCPRPWR
jgi:ribonuclease HI